MGRDNVPCEQPLMVRMTGCPFQRPPVPLHESGQGLPKRMSTPRITTPCEKRLDNTFFFLILTPLRHCGAAYHAGILGAASSVEMADV